MRRQKLTMLVACVAVAVCLGMLIEPVAAYRDGATREATTSQLMKGLVGANCGALKKELDAEETDWEKISLHAALLNEAGYILMADERCPDGDWASGARALQTHSAALLEQAEAEDLDAAKAAFGELTSNGCAVCHEAHRPAE
jgi:hypothetical protein